MQMNNKMTAARLLALGVTAATLAMTKAVAADTESWNAKFQSTYVWQVKRPFNAPYSGPNSLSSGREKSYSFTATAALGFRPWKDGELYFDPEATQGVPLSHLAGLGGLSNGEIARTAGSTLTVYRARLFLRQTWGMGGSAESVESAANQLAGSVDRQRWVLTAGNLSVSDIFDNNAYSHDPRTQFLNSALATYGAYDYAADAHGYTWGAALEYYGQGWALRAGRFIQPREPNQLALDPRIFRHYGDQVELERGWQWGDRPGKLRLLAYRNRTLMSRYRDALDLAAATATTPDINAVRNGEQIKRGIGLNLEQAVSANAGLFSRAMWADGRTETYAFTEIDRSFSAGGVVKGAAWGRGDDTLGLAVAVNALSKDHRNYLAAGGIGFFLGDGALNYRPESILEAFYNLAAIKGGWVTLDWQHIRNPGYNADRGPANFISLRLHAEF